MWNLSASEVGDRVHWGRPIQNNLTRALLYVSTSGTPYVLQMNFSPDIAVFGERTLAKAKQISVMLLKHRPGRFLTMATELKHTITAGCGMEGN